MEFWIILSAIPRCIKISSDSLEDLEKSRAQSVLESVRHQNFCIVVC